MYREARFDEHCVWCDAVTAARCARCGDLCCGWHLHTDDAVCSTCEEGWQERLDASPRARTGRVIAGLLALAAVVFLWSGHPALGLVIGLALAGLLFDSVLGLQRVRARRLAYLGERRQAKPAPEDARLRHSVPAVR